jgi:hypothetical protein
MVSAARVEEDQLHQSRRVPGLSSSPPITGNQFRSVSRLEDEAVLDRMQARLSRRPGILGRRRETVEHPFGTIKQWMYQGAFPMRGLANVRAEFSLTALTYNLTRALNLVGFTELMAAVQGGAAQCFASCRVVPRYLASWVHASLSHTTR